MADVEIAETARHAADVVLTWVGFGTLTGLLAKAIMPGRDPGGTVATMSMGIGGTVIGLGTLAYFSDGQKISPISPLGFLVATGGAFVLLFFYRLLAGHFFTEGHYHLPEPRFVRRRRRAPVAVQTVEVED
ncbi:MAG: GlsB/YeaQ/YmgE family stress response membrane protein [Pirellulales bacterium]